MKKPLLLHLALVVLFVIGAIDSSLSQEAIDNYKVQPKKVKTGSFIECYIQQPNVEDCYRQNVNFNVKDDDGNAITDAVVTFNNVQNNPGVYVFEGILPGVYAYTVKKSGYVTVVGAVEVANQHLTVDITLSVQTYAPIDLKDDKWITLYPNPNSGLFTLEIRDIKNQNLLNVTVLDPTGRVVYSKNEGVEGEQVKLEINLSHLPKGIYIARVSNSESVGIKKLIIN